MRTGAGERIPASLPPAGLPGLLPGLSRLVTALDAAGGAATWHVLDTGPSLDALGVTPAGTILAVHGNPTWSYLWRRIAAESVARAEAGESAWRVIAPDQLEMGFSERTGRHRTLADRVRDLGALTDALDLEGPVITLGHDWGGVVSMGWAVDHSDRLAAVTLLNTAISHPAGIPIPAPLRLALAPGVFRLGTVTTPAFLETTLALARPALPADVREAFREPYRGSVRREGIGGFVADIPADESHVSRPELDRIAEGIRGVDVPSLLLWGPEDPIFGDRYLDDLIDRLQEPYVHRFEGAGHLIAEDAPYASAILDWLALYVAPAAPGSATRPATAPQPPERRRPLWHHLDARADSAEPALVELVGASTRVIPWHLLARRVREVAAGLSHLGVRPGDRVSLLVPPGAHLTAALYACLRIGAVVVVADAGLGVPGLTRAVRGAQADWVIGARKGLAAARALGWPGRRISTTTLAPAARSALGVTTSLPELARAGRGADLPAMPAADEVAAVLFTSGSTGPAKGVVYTHRQLEALTAVLAEQYAVTPDSGLVAGFAPFALLGPAIGARTATPDMDVTAPRTLTARAVAAAVAAADASILFLSPAAIAGVVGTAAELDAADRAALAAVGTVLSAGAPVSAALLTELLTLLPNATAHTPYGMTEGLLMTDITLEEIRAARTDERGGVCVGRPAPGVTVLLSALDEDGRATGEPSATPGVTGEIVVSAPHLKQGYDRLHLTDRTAVDGTPPGSRWHRTGDVGHLDADGRVWVEGRLPHVLVTAEGVLTPVGPEQRLETVPGIVRAGLAGVGPRGAQQPVAVVETDPPVRRAGLADERLTAAARAVAGIPLAAVLAVPRLPTDIRHNSKIERARLSRWAEGVLAGGRMGEP
ncbi:MAG TPA: alpha/beta fold hydrolase [Naasia sp.]|jgi:acyl-CoA synthetase (AMP-forming)/AMP-acid ligase II/pimeloyl-ACP methyl ester carboxylesterase